MAAYEHNPLTDEMIGFAFGGSRSRISQLLHLAASLSHCHLEMPTENPK